MKTVLSREETSKLSLAGGLIDMIEISPNTAVMLYLGLTLAVLLGIWCSHHYFSRKEKISLLEQELLVCEYCHCAYLEDLGKKITQCPQCRSFNRKE